MLIYERKFDFFRLVVSTFVDSGCLDSLFRENELLLLPAITTPFTVTLLGVLRGWEIVAGWK